MTLAFKPSVFQMEVIRKMSRGQILELKFSKSGDLTDWRLSDGTCVPQRSVEKLKQNDLITQRSNRHCVISLVGLKLLRVLSGEPV